MSRAPRRSLLLTILLLGRDVVPQRALRPLSPLDLGAPRGVGCTWPDCQCPPGPDCWIPE